MLAGLLVASAGAARADIAVLVGGDTMKIERYELRGEHRMALWLRGGGQVVLPLGRLERIVDDEIVPATPLPPLPAFDLGFAAGQAPPEVPYGDLFHAAGRKHRLNPQLLAAVARAESAYDPRAVSRKGARGLLQLMPATAARFGVARRELFDPARNVEAGARYLAFLVERFEGDLARVLAAYNAGEGAVDRYRGVPPYRETQGYVARVLRYLGIEAAAAAASGSVAGAPR